MAITRYNLGDIKRRIRIELGLEDRPEVNEQITDKVNEAQDFIVRKRGNWRWQLTELEIELSPAVTASVFLTKGARSATVTNVSGPLTKRSVLVGSTSSGYGTEGYLVSNVSGSTVTLKSQYRGATLNGTTSRFMSGYVLLPEDFMGLETAHDLETVEGEVYRFLSNIDFQRFKNTQRVAIETQKFYTILRDPLGENTRAYFAMFPYLDELTTIHTTYYRSAPTLVEDIDESIIPPADRAALYYATLWFVAQARSYDKAIMYRDMALNELELMMDQNELSVGTYEEGPGPITLDLSGLRDINDIGEQDYSPNII